MELYSQVLYTFVIGEFNTSDPSGGVGSSLNDFLFVDGDNGNQAVDWNLKSGRMSLESQLR